MKRVITIVLLWNIFFVSSALYSLQVVRAPEEQMIGFGSGSNYMKAARAPEEQMSGLMDQISKKLKLEKAALENYLSYQAIDQAIKKGLSIGQIEARIAKIDQVLSIVNIPEVPSTKTPKLEAIKASEDVRPLVAVPGL